tara:strand:+ start:36 stop:179 length:144 start_codon:yes stop_codon:yes gene_type:complete
MDYDMILMVEIFLIGWSAFNPKFLTDGRLMPYYQTTIQRKGRRLVGL